MNARWLLLFAFLGCAPADTSEEVESTESDLTTFGRGLTALDASHYYSNQSNAARELDLAGAGNVPGVLASTHSTSPYAYAGTLELVTWSSISTEGDLVVRVDGPPSTKSGKAAKAIYDALNLPETNESGAVVKRTPGGSVTCFKYPNHHQCALGGFSFIQPK